jgi:hypothetical protein
LVSTDGWAGRPEFVKLVWRRRRQDTLTKSSNPTPSAALAGAQCRARLAGWLVPIIREYLDRYPLPAETPVFANTVGKPLRRTLFLARVWRPALARAGMLGTLTVIGDNTVRAGWTDDTGAKLAKEFATSNVKTCGCGSVLPSF